MSAVVELRVLNGRHAGARASVRGGESIGASDACDLVLTDIGVGEDVAAWLLLRAGAWSLASEPPKAEPEATDVSQPLALPAEPGNSLGDVAYLGSVALTVCSEDAPWQKVPQRAIPARKDALPQVKEEDVSPLSPASTPEVQAGDGPQERGAEPQTATTLPARPHARKISVGWFVALALLVLAVTVLWNLLRGPGLPPASEAQTAPRIDLSQQPQLVRSAQLAVASVDPSLRLSVEGLPDGRVRVSGWVADVAQLDRLAEKLAALRPLPQLAVRTVADVTDDLREATRNAGIRKAAFELLGSGRVTVLGLVMDEAERQQAMQSLRASMPGTLVIEDGLRMASSQGPAMQEWLRKGGFSGAKAEWKDGRMQLHLALAPQERPRLENLLARADGPMSEVLFTLHVQELAPEQARVLRVATAPAAHIHVSAAPLPFRIRSVVGGANSYVMLSDGSRLQPGGARNGWRLESVEADTLTFSGPKKLVLAR
ncbi:hypothetical protein SDC9_63695 [bioreactor metagenome]|uniref:Yop protein translocation protein D periplasmic domain-containing protein n=1 Tax=bioreactor metagenome TaxID=1076179 RepID=A0A644XMU0_9ZZZZ